MVRHTRAGSLQINSGPLLSSLFLNFGNRRFAKPKHRRVIEMTLENRFVDDGFIILKRAINERLLAESKDIILRALNSLLDDDYSDVETT